MCGDKYFIKVQPAVCYESTYNNMLLLTIFIVGPMNSIHKFEINSIAPIRLDQELSSRIVLVLASKKFCLVRYNAVIL